MSHLQPRLIFFAFGQQLRSRGWLLIFPFCLYFMRCCDELMEVFFLVQKKKFFFSFFKYSMQFLVWLRKVENFRRWSQCFRPFPNSRCWIKTVSVPYVFFFFFSSVIVPDWLSLFITFSGSRMRLDFLCMTAVFRYLPNMFLGLFPELQICSFGNLLDFTNEAFHCHPKLKVCNRKSIPSPPFIRLVLHWL